MNKLVYNIEPASATMIASLDRHCLVRVPDGASAIDPARSHLNQILLGDPGGLSRSLKNLYSSGVKRPTAQAEKPYLRIVASASPSYFRPEDPDAVGTWDEDRLAIWIDATLGQLLSEHGHDLIFVELHLDEDTPHIHAVVAPTYARKARKPGKQKRGESPAEFEARKAAALASKGERTVGRASHPTLSKPNSFLELRKRMAIAVAPLGIEYGDDRMIDAPAGKSTREWVKDQAAELRQSAKELEEQAREKARQLAQEIRDAEKVKKQAEAARLAEEARVEAARQEAERLEAGNQRITLEQEAATKELAEERARLQALQQEVAELGPQRAALASVKAAIAQETTRLDQLRAEAETIMADARKQAKEYWDKVRAETVNLMRATAAEWADFVKVPEPFRQAVNNVVSLREAITETLQQLGLASRRSDLGERDETGEPPPVLELIFRRADRKAKAKNELIRTNERNGPGRSM